MLARGPDRVAVVIAMAADGDVFVAELRVGPREDGDDIAGRKRRPRHLQVDRHRFALGALGQLIERRAEDGLRHLVLNRGQRPATAEPEPAAARLHRVLERSTGTAARGKSPSAPGSAPGAGPCGGDGQHGRGGSRHLLIRLQSGRDGPATPPPAKSTAGDGAEHEQPPAHRVHRQDVGGVIGRPAEHGRRVHEGARRLGSGGEIGAEVEDLARHGDGRGAVNTSLEDREILEVSATVPGGLEAHPADFALEVCGGAQVVRRTDPPAQHRVVRVDVEAGHQITGRDRRHGGAALVLEGHGTMLARRTFLLCRGQP